MKTFRQNRKKLIQDKMQSVRVKRDDHGEIIRKIGINRNLHTLKYDTFIPILGIPDPNKRPILNLPLPDLSDESYAAKMKEMERFFIGYSTIGMILPFIIAKYPNLERTCKIFLKQYLAIREYFIPIMDDRWDRNIPEWEQIVAYAKTYGYNAASRRFPAIKDGNEKYLSPSYIKQKEKEIDRFHNSFKKMGNAKKLAKCAFEISEVINSDRELLKIAKRLYRQYFSKIVDEFLNRSETYSYNYFYIRHYDPHFYKRQKSDLKRKGKITGKIECGPFKISTLEKPYAEPITGITRHLIKFMIKRRVKQNANR